jgi:hypothetical protein
MEGPPLGVIAFKIGRNGLKDTLRRAPGAIFKSICRPEFSTKTDDEVHNPISMDQENTYKPVLGGLEHFEKWPKNHSG